MTYLIQNTFSVTFFINFFFFFFTGVFQSRIFVKYIYDTILKVNRKSVAIYGIGEEETNIAMSLLNSKEYKVAFFINDERDTQGYKITGIPIINLEKSEKSFNKHNVSTLLISSKNLPTKIKENILSKLSEHNIKVKIIPEIEKIIENKITINDFKSISILDLLKREQIPPQKSLMAINIHNKSVMVTGAGGSIGSEICRQILKYNPKTLLILDISEINLFNINNELKEFASNNNLDIRIVEILGSINNRKLLDKKIKKYKVHTIFHAAAYKHVHLLELNPFEAVINNIFGTKTIADVAEDNFVETFVVVSSDKAVKPTSIMGATKRFAEIICLNRDVKKYKTKFTAVRFGNVFRSSGSVFNIFNRQILQGGPITVTHQNVTRYFMTMSEAAQLVIQAGGLSNGGEVFILNMGESIKILDLAKQMARLRGLTPYIKGIDKIPENNGIEISIIGLRKGEKMHEELLVDNSSKSTLHPRIMFENNRSYSQKEINVKLLKLENACRKYSLDEVIEVFKESDIDFKHQNNIS